MSFHTGNDNNDIIIRLWEYWHGYIYVCTLSMHSNRCLLLLLSLQELSDFAVHEMNSHKNNWSTKKQLLWGEQRKTTNSCFISGWDYIHIFRWSLIYLIILSLCLIVRQIYSYFSLKTRPHNLYKYYWRISYIQKPIPWHSFIIIATTVCMNDYQQSPFIPLFFDINFYHSCCRHFTFMGYNH